MSQALTNRVEALERELAALRAEFERTAVRLHHDLANARQAAELLVERPRRKGKEAA